LRDHDRDFGSVRFAAMVLDEAQKVKTPGIRLTDAVKAMNADFRVALTGTPVENRLADLWCIVDGVAPGHLGDLRRFSASYETSPTVERLAELKASLDRPFGGRPPLLLRRLKEDRLPDLPPRCDAISRAEMRGVQLVAYEEAVALGRSDQGAGRVLEALQRLRAVSLHPEADAAVGDAEWIVGSARLGLALEALDAIAEKGERALVFLDDLTMMARLAGLLQRRFRLPAAPMTISGKVAGAARQARVDRFQEAPGGFDVMLLSPRAGGVGLTLTRANHVIHLARWWNPAVEDQCTGRVLRIGQELPVTVHVPLAVLPDGKPSFDENLHTLLERKRRLMRDALMPPDAQPNDLAAMLRDSLA
jgi:SNF2 family DNA or RNA helicase